MTKTSGHDIFRSLDPQIRATILNATERLKIRAGDHLFEAGDAGDAIYVVTTGSLGVYFPGPTGYPQLSAVIKPGETVGEMAVISGEPRSATVTAIRDCELIKLTRVEFDRLVQSKPVIMNELNRLLVHRLQQVATQSQGKLEPKTIALLPASQNSNLSLMLGKLTQVLTEDEVKYTVISAKNGMESLNRLSQLEAQCDLVLFLGQSGEVAWNAKCARQADRILIIANADERPHSDLSIEVLRQRAIHQLVDLILLQPKTISLPKKTTAWLDTIPVNRHFHIRDTKADWQHLAKILTGRGLGVVLSGGGARAYAHIGALRAIQDMGLTIDFLGGSSMGAIIAACHAHGWTIDEIERRVRHSFVSSNPLSDYTLPLMSLVRGHKVERLLFENFGEANIADLWTPFFCVSSNLTNGLVHIHKTDKLWKALRASIALPGILPPVPTKHGILVDGGVLDNMPVDVMRGAHRGPVIAVDVAREQMMDTEWFERENNRPWYRKALSPPIIAILMRSGTVNGEAISRKQAGRADLIVEPPLGGIEIRQWKCFDETIEIGYNETMKQLKNAKPQFT
ncbi:Serine protease [hydrothermal vent metagenome]|uniref:Serine protease n=1 Tax=hydrothermal vent metagenome TaxID=652676 RepID=A0A3B0RGY2_9ZZZZ